MFLLELLFILFLGLSVGAILTYIIESSLGGIIMTMDFTSVPVSMIAAVIGIFGIAVVKYLYDEHKEGKKTSRIDVTTTDTKQIVQGVDKKLDYHSEAMKEQSGKLERQSDKLENKLDKQFQMQYTKLDEIDKFVAESRVLNQAAINKGLDSVQIIASIQAMTAQILQLQDKLEAAEKEIGILTKENKILRSKISERNRPPVQEQEEPEL